MFDAKVVVLCALVACIQAVEIPKGHSYSHKISHPPSSPKKYAAAPVAHHEPAPIAYHAPAPIAYHAPAPAPIAYHAPAPIAYHAPAPSPAHKYTSSAYSSHQDQPSFAQQSSSGHEAHSEHQDYHAEPKYEFKYGVEDSHSGDKKSQEESRDGDHTQGQYSLVEPDGTILTVKYSVIGKSGFNAIVHRTGHGAHPHASH